MARIQAPATLQIRREAVSVRLASHCIRLSRAGLAIRKHRGIVPIQKRIQQRRRQIIVNFGLRHIGMKDGVVGEFPLGEGDGAVECVAVHDGVAAFACFFGG